MAAGERQELVDQLLVIVDDANHADRVGAKIGTDQQGLRLIVADTADRCGALHLIQDLFKLGSEGRVLYVVDFTLQAEIRIIGRKPTPACAEVGVVVGSEEYVGHAVAGRCNSEKASHGGTS